VIELQHGGLQARIAPLGAELQSLRRGTDEFLWQPQAGVWQQTAPWLFPFIGRMKDGGYLHRGQRYAMPLHGFAAKLPFDVLEQSPSHARLELLSSPATRQHFPFAFSLRVQYRLEADGLRIDVELGNERAEPLPFALGFHPGFALPLQAGEGLDAWSLQFEQPEADEVWRLCSEPPPYGLLNVDGEPMSWTTPACLQLRGDLFARDALFFKQIRSRWVALVHRERGERLRLHLGGAPQLGLWARPGAPYVCIEPWWGHDDDADASIVLAEKRQLLALQAGRLFAKSFVLSV
jgi:galactose mutarotase-like enzyme